MSLGLYETLVSSREAALSPAKISRANPDVRMLALSRIDFSNPVCQSLDARDETQW